MKKAISVFLALVLVLALSVPALAADVSEIKIEWLDLPGMPQQYISESDLLVIKNADGKYGIVERTTGKTVTPFEYDSIYKYTDDGLAVAVQTDANGARKYGFLDTAGQLALPVQYEQLDFYYTYVDFGFHEGLALISQTSNGITKYGYINMEGEIVIPVEYEIAGYFSEGLAPVKDNTTWKYIDVNGNVAFTVNCSNAGPFSEGVAFILNGGNISFIDTSGEILSAFDSGYPKFSCSHNGILVVTVDGKDGCVDIYGNWTIPAEYEAIGQLGTELILAKSDSKYGYLDYTGEVVIPFEYDHGYYEVKDGLARVGNDEADGITKWGLLNSDNTYILPLEYDDVRLMERYVAVELDGRYGLFENPYCVSNEPVEEETEEVPEVIPEETPVEEHSTEKSGDEVPAEEPVSDSETVSAPEVTTQSSSAKTAPLLIVFAAVAVLAIGAVIILLKKKKAAK